MDLSNPLYKNQGIHVNIVLFTVNNGEIDVLLVKRNNQPFDYTISRLILSNISYQTARKRLYFSPKSCTIVAPSYKEAENDEK